MPYLSIADFKYGMDRRRPQNVGVPGTLWNAKNCVISRGGDIEGAKKWVEEYALPAGDTFGLYVVDGDPWVFGSGTEPMDLPAGVFYQQLISPDTANMIRVHDVKEFDGKLYVIAEYDDGFIGHFYDGVRVDDWDFATGDANDFSTVAFFLANRVSQDENVSDAEATGADVEITGDVEGALIEPEEWDAGHKDADVTLLAADRLALYGGGSTDYGNVFGDRAHTSGLRIYQLIVFNVGPSGALSAVGVGNASASTGGNSTNWLGFDTNSVGWFSDGDVQFNNLSVGTVDGFTSGDFLYIAVNADDREIWFKVNSGDWNSTPGADPFTKTGGGDISGVTGDLFVGASLIDNFNGVILSDVSEPFTIETAVVDGGSATTPTAAIAHTQDAYVGAQAVGGILVNTAAATDDVTSLSVVGPGGTEIFLISTPQANYPTLVNAGDNEADAAASLAQLINAEYETHGFFAFAIDDTLFIFAPDPGIEWNDRTVNFVGSGTNGTATPFANGVDPTPQIETVTIDGAMFDSEDSWTITINDQTYSVVADASQIGIALFVKHNRVWSISNSLLRYSALNDAEDWIDDEDEAALDAGFINVSTDAYGAQRLTALAKYENLLAVFARNNIVIYETSTDATQIQVVETVDNTGTRSTRSPVAYGNNDVYYLHQTGVRSLRAREGISVSPYVSDIGSAVDTFIQELMANASDDEITRAVGAIEPTGGRYMLALGDTVMVLSHYPEQKIIAWTYLEPGFAISDMVSDGLRLWARSGDSIYIYGGSSGDEYPTGGTLSVVDTIVSTPSAPDTGTTLLFEVWDRDILVGDLLLVHAAADAEITGVSLPSGWSAISGITNGAVVGTALSGFCAYKIADEDDAAAGIIVFDWLNNQERAGALMIIRGHDPDTPIDIASEATGTSTTPQSPTATTTVDGALIIRAFIADDDDTPYAQTGSPTLTELFNAASTAAGPGIFGGSYIQETAGAAGTFGFTQNASEEWRAVTIAIRPGGFAVEAQTVIETAYTNANDPAGIKMLEGFDADVTGTWTVKVLPDPTDPTIEINVGTITESTYHKPYIKIPGRTSHAAFKFTSSSAGIRRLSSLALHFEKSETD